MPRVHPNYAGSTGCGKLSSARVCHRARLQSCRKCSRINAGFSPCAMFVLAKTRYIDFFRSLSSPCAAFALSQCPCRTREPDRSGYRRTGAAPIPGPDHVRGNLSKAASIFLQAQSAVSRFMQQSSRRQTRHYPSRDASAFAVTNSVVNTENIFNERLGMLSPIERRSIRVWQIEISYPIDLPEWAPAFSE